jgi:hypothetical protein
MTHRSVLLAILLAFATPSYAAVHLGKQIQAIFPGDNTHACVYFALQGVVPADSGVSTSAWFALSPNHPRFKETYALLISARLAGETIDVGTTGTAASSCGGYVEVNYVVMGQQPPV